MYCYDDAGFYNGFVSDSCTSLVGTELKFKGVLTYCVCPIRSQIEPLHPYTIYVHIRVIFCRIAVH